MDWQQGAGIDMQREYPFHEEATVEVNASSADVFAILDDHRSLSSHMESSSLVLAGSAMHIELDRDQGKAVGSRIRLSGRVFGVRLLVDEEVCEYEPPRRKVWETTGEPRLLVIGRYRMGFSLSPVEAGSSVRIWIDYELPMHGIARWLGRLAGSFYARWCTRQMLLAVRSA